MMTVANPYADDLGERAPLEALADTADRIRRLVESWSAEAFEKTYAPGKWSARQILVHLAQTELALGTRARFALTQPGYTAQAFSQDDWMPIDGATDARTALAAYTSLRGMNLAMWRRLSPAQLDRGFSHPEYGGLSVGWIMAQMAGHDVHHLKQLQAIQT
ncbi:MAG TPA: DinB family protein [Vicinamibacterales bacterium]|nr:DinB family protein [Vicinamibacterales bacterium]